MNNCEHKRIKYFKESDRIVCEDCGETFVKEYTKQFQYVPYVPVQPIEPPIYPYPTSPTITWVGTGVVRY